MKRVIVIMAGAVLVTFSACSKKPDIGGTNAEKMANEWWVTISQGSTVYTSPQHFYTYNTAANTNEIWIDDAGHIWDFKVKAVADLNALTFSANQAESVVPGYNIKVNITEGKIIPNAGHSKTGNATDSIYMKAEFEDDPGSIYVISGHARTRFAEDDY